MKKRMSICLFFFIFVSINASPYLKVEDFIIRENADKNDVVKVFLGKVWRESDYSKYGTLEERKTMEIYSGYKNIEKLSYQGITIYIASLTPEDTHKEVVEIEVKTNVFVTNGGFSIGDNINKVLLLYGDPDSSFLDNSQLYYSYEIANPFMEYDDVQFYQLQFKVEDGIITAILIYSIFNI